MMTVSPMATRAELCRAGYWSNYCYLLLLVSCAAGLAGGRVIHSAATTAAEARTTDAAGPSSEEVQQKCGFTLEAIHACTLNKCKAAVGKCVGENFTLPVKCVLQKCKEAEAVCEEPLNANLSAEAVCQRDGFAKVNTDCTIVVSKSNETFSHCDIMGYMQVRRRCFSSIWRKELKQAATEMTGATQFTDEFFECVDKNCHSRSENCPDYLQNVTRRYFSLESCSYTIASFPHACENPVCPSTIDKCFRRSSSAARHSGLVVLVVIVGVLLLAALVMFVVNRKNNKLHGSSSISYNRVDD